MSGAGTAAKPRVRFCWACGRKLQANFHRVVSLGDGTTRIVHAACVDDYMEIVPGAHLARKGTP